MLANDFLTATQKNSSTAPKLSSYNYRINTQELHEDSVVEEIIQLRREKQSNEKNVADIMKEQNSETEAEMIKDMYVRQITRVLRIIYFISLKCKEQHLYQLRCLTNVAEEDLKQIDIKIFYVTMRLTAFDDMDNYNKNMKVALKCLSVILQSNHAVNKEEVYRPLVQIFKAHYRSDLIHRRIKPSIDSLKEDIESSSLPANGKEDFLNILEENLCNTLDKIDAIYRFKLLLRDPDFKNYLERFRFQLSKFSSSKDNSLKVQQKIALRSVTDLKLHLMKLCSDLHYNLSMNFDFSYSFEKGKQWVRIPNIFNLSNEIVTRVRSSTKMKYLQHQKEIECNTNDLIESDIIPSATRESTTIKKTVNIEVGDMDLETINFPTNEEDNKENGDSSASSDKEQETEEKVSEDDSNKFQIKNFELTKEFMKGRQCGRENTPIRGRERKERKKKLAKINVNLPKSGQIKKAWDDDSQLSPVMNSIDPV